MQTHCQTDREEGIHTERHKDRQREYRPTGIHIFSQTGKQTDSQKDRQTYIQTDLQTDTQAYRQTDINTVVETERQSGGQTDIQINSLTA